MFSAALFTIARTGKQARCPLTGACIKRLWYRYTMEYHSVIKRNKAGSSEEMWRDPRACHWVQSERVRKRRANTRYECIYVGSRNGTDDPICRAGIEAPSHMDTEGEGGARQMERGALTCTRCHVGSRCATGGSAWRRDDLEGMQGRRLRRGRDELAQG